MLMFGIRCLKTVVVLLGHRRHYQHQGILLAKIQTTKNKKTGNLINTINTHI